LLDMGVTALVAYLLVVVLGVLAVAGAEVLAWIAGLFFLVAMLIAYPALMEGLWGGRTLGKAMVGLRVVRVDGGPIGLSQATVRAALGLLEVWGTLGSLGLFVILLSKRDQRLGDMAAGTLVLRQERGGSLLPVPLLVPPGCQQLVQTLDIGAMSEGDYHVVRAFLLRWRDFSQADRPVVAARLAAPLWQRFKHPLPPWLGPDFYLACLGAAYQYRHAPGQAMVLQPSPEAAAPGAWLQQGGWGAASPVWQGGATPGAGSPGQAPPAWGAGLGAQAAAGPSAPGAALPGAPEGSGGWAPPG
jgi:uncharacterized RDD family membrane protein YckC